MQRRSFFSVVFGGLAAGMAAWWLPRKRTVTYVELNRAYDEAVAADPQFTAFTSNPRLRSGVMVGGQYAPDQPIRDWPEPY